MREGEPAAMKLIRSILPKRQSPEEVMSMARDLSGVERAEVVRIITGGSRDVPTIVHLFKSFEDRFRVRLDVAILLEYAQKFQAGAEVVEAITVFERGLFENAKLRDQLEREERERVRIATEAEARHGVTMLEIEQERSILQGPLPRQVEEARLLAEIEKLTGSPEETTLKMWEKMVGFWKDDIAGADKFTEFTDKDIDSRYKAQLANIPSNAADADVLKRAAAETRDTLRQRRDGLLAEMARHLADKLAFDRRKKAEEDRRR